MDGSSHVKTTVTKGKRSVGTLKMEGTHEGKGCGIQAEVHERPRRCAHCRVVSACGKEKTLKRV